MKDPLNILINANEGKTKSLRQWRFTHKDQIDEKQILAYIKEAIDNEKNGLKLLPEKHVPATLPKILSDALAKNKQLQKAFENLSSGKQKEYIVYLNEAKQEQTKTNRLTKIEPMIL